MQEYGRLRHRYIVQGEVSVNEWHDHFLAHGARRTSLMSNKPLPPPPSSQKASIQSIVQHWTGLAQRRNQVSCSAQCLGTKWICPACVRSDLTRHAPCRMTVASMARTWMAVVSRSYQQR
jgi:hypothetical protein